MEELCTGAGVVAYSFDHNNVPVILLGREKCTPGWKQGSNKWGAFSGKADKGETIEESAAREFMEESMAVVPFDDVPVPITTASLVDELVARRYTRRIEHLSKGKDGILRKHVLFLRRIPFGEYRTCFNQYRVSLGRLEEILRRHNRLRALVTTPRMCQIGFHLSPSVVVVNVEYAGDGIFKVHLHDGDIPSMTIIKGFTSQEEHDVRKIIRSWSDIKVFIEAGLSDDILEHPALCLRFSGGILIGARVNKTFLEKSQIGWWAVPELQRAVQNNDEILRRPFGDVVPAIIDGIDETKQMFSSNQCSFPSNIKKQHVRNRRSASSCLPKPIQRPHAGYPASD